MKFADISTRIHQHYRGRVRGTGGGCTAINIDLADGGHILITGPRASDGETNEPKAEDTSVTVGVYTDARGEDWRFLGDVDVEQLDAFLAEEIASQAASGSPR